MMRANVLALALGAGALLGVGVWIGRASSASAEQPAAAAPTRVVTAPVVVTTAPPAQPGLPAPVRKRAAPLPGLEKDLRDPDPKVRRAAMHEAVKDPETEVSILLAASRDADNDVAFAATGALAQRYQNREVPIQELIARATDHALDAKVRLLALNGVASMPSDVASEALRALLKSGDETERRSAASLLAQQDPELAIPALIDALSDPDELVRANAHDSLRARARGRDFATDAAAWRAWWQSQH